MSILIKGMDMPKENESLRIEIFSDGGIWIDEGRRYSRRNNAVIEIPTPHGRLIDADKYEYPGDLIYEPTILEAEEN